MRSTPETPAGKDAGLVLTAEVTGAHGVGGNLRLRLIGANAQVAVAAMQATESLMARSPDGSKAAVLTLRSLRSLQTKGAWTAHFKELTNRAAAEGFYGWGLYVDEKARPKLDEGEYYVDDLLGMSVVTDTGHDLGTLVEVLNTPANDVYVTSRDVMVPAVAAFVIDVDQAKRVITVRDIPGLRDDMKA